MTCMDVGVGSEFRWWRAIVVALGLLAIGVWYLSAVDSVVGKIQFFSYVPLFMLVPSSMVLLAYGLKQQEQPSEFVVFNLLGCLALCASVLFGTLLAFQHGWYSAEMRACIPGWAALLVIGPMGSYLGSKLKERVVTGGILMLPLFVFLILHALLLRIPLQS